MEPLYAAQAGDMEKATEHARSPRFEAYVVSAMGASHAVHLRRLRRALRLRTP